MDKLQSDITVTIQGNVGSGKTQVVEAIRNGLAGRFYISDYVTRNTTEIVTLAKERRVGNITPRHHISEDNYAKEQIK